MFSIAARFDPDCGSGLADPEGKEKLDDEEVRGAVDEAVVATGGVVAAKTGVGKSEKLGIVKPSKCMCAKSVCDNPRDAAS